MPSTDLWTRLRQARIVRVVVFYLGACWVVLQVVDILQDALALPEWLAPVSVVLLLVGGVVIVATALVQGSPETDVREEAGEVPRPWQVAPKELGRSLAAGKLPHLTWGRTLLGGLMAFWFLFGLAGLYVLIKDRGATFAPVEAAATEAGTGVAVVPFQVQGSADLDLWREGMVDLFSTNLDGVGGFRTIDSRTLLARWGERIGSNRAPDLPAILAVASETGAAYAMVGSAVGLGSNVRLTADVYEVATGVEVGQAQVEGRADDVLSLVDQLSVDVMRALLEGAGKELPPMQHTASITTSSLPALRAYLESEAQYRRADFPAAIEALERAIQADSTFALAYYRLGDAYGWVEDIGSDQGARYMVQARRYADRLPPRYVVLLDGAVGLLSQDLTVSRALEEAVRRYPDDPEIWFLLGEFFLHYAEPLMKSLDDIDRVFTRAVQLDPTFAPYYIHLVEVAIAKRDGERARDLLDRYQSMAADLEDRAFLRWGYDLALGDSAALAEALVAIDTVDVSTLIRLWAELGVPGIGTKHMEHLARAAFDQTGQARFLGSQAQALIAGGRIQEAKALLRDERLDQDQRRLVTSQLHTLVEPLPVEHLDSVYLEEPCGAEHPSEVCSFTLGSHLIERERWDEVERLIRLNRDVAAGLRSDVEAVEGGGAHARAHENVATTLEARRMWAEGRRREAVEALGRILGDPAGAEPAVRAMLGSIHEELGETRQAIRYYESFWPNVQRWYFMLRMGDLYAELGDTERARAYFAIFLEDWADADPDRPEVARARAALEQLGG